jgi:hypothetical protein
MASTTTAAASMLLSGSMSSADGIMNPNLLARAILPCSSSMATISASAPFPTVTLDLTHSSPNPLQFQRSPSQFPVHFPGQAQSFWVSANPTTAPGSGVQSSTLQPVQICWPSAFSRHGASPISPPTTTPTPATAAAVIGRLGERRHSRHHRRSKLHRRSGRRHLIHHQRSSSKQQHHHHNNTNSSNANMTTSNTNNRN